MNVNLMKHIVIMAAFLLMSGGISWASDWKTRHGHDGRYHRFEKFDRHHYGLHGRHFRSHHPKIVHRYHHRPHYRAQPFCLERNTRFHHDGRLFHRPYGYRPQTGFSFSIRIK